MKPKTILRLCSALLLACFLFAMPGAGQSAGERSPNPHLLKDINALTSQSANIRLMADYQGQLFFNAMLIFTPVLPCGTRTALHQALAGSKAA